MYADILLGNFHALILFHDDKQLETVSQVVHRLVHRAIALDGTCKPYEYNTFTIRRGKQRHILIKTAA
jgi:hypothetical protein